MNESLVYQFSDVKRNHLGNVLSVISDKVIPHDNGSGVVDYYLADIRHAGDFSPFGVELSGRTFDLSGAGDYRYGFQNQEVDNEIKGEGNSVNYKYRMHDPRIGRFFARDPLTSEYPDLTPYQFSSNRVIDFIEVEGLEGTKAQFTATIGLGISLSKSTSYTLTTTLSLTTQTKLTGTTLSSEFLAKGRVNFQTNKSPSGYYSFGGMLGAGNNSNQAGVATAGNSNGNNNVIADFKPSLGFGSTNETTISGNDFKGAGVSSLTTFGKNNQTSLSINGRLDLGGVKFTDIATVNSTGNFFDINRKTSESTFAFSYSTKDQNFGLGFGLLNANTTIESAGAGIYPSSIGGNTLSKMAVQVGGTFSFQNGLENINGNVLIGGTNNPLSKQRFGGLQSATLNQNFKGKSKGFSFQTGAGVSTNNNGQKLF